MKKVTGIVMAAIPLFVGSFLLLQVKTPPTKEMIQQQITQKMDKELYIDVLELIDEYSQGTIDVEWLFIKAKAYEGLRQSDEAIAVYEKIVKDFPQEKRAYNALIQFYKADYPKKYYQLLQRMQQAFPDEDIKEFRLYRLDVEKQFLPADHMVSYRDGYSVFQIGKQYGIMDKQLDVLAQAEFDWVSSYSKDTQYFAAIRDNRAFYIDENGYKRMVPDINYEQLGYQNDGRAFAKRNGKYGYVDYQFNELTPFDYEDATSFYHDIAVVKYNGKWRFVNRNFEKIGSEFYDDILMDHDKVMNEFGVIWVRQNEEWYLLDEQLNRLSHIPVKSAKRFISMQPCAVELADGWAFMNNQGELVNEQRFNQASSFYNSRTVVKLDENNWISLFENFEYGPFIEVDNLSQNLPINVLEAQTKNEKTTFMKWKYIE